jgi:hypothetical protein
MTHISTLFIKLNIYQIVGLSAALGQDRTNDTGSHIIVHKLFKTQFPQYRCGFETQRVEI